MRSARLAKSGLYLAAASAVVLFSGRPSAVRAAEAAPSAHDLEELVVTAQRRPERASDVPVSLTARSGDQLELMQATDMADLGKVAPSLVMTRTGAFTQPYLRGVGKRSTLGVENGVATYVDGVYLASSISALLDLRGVERVEVMNGPQGTLFGRNAIGGVIQIVTRDPSPGFSGEAQAHAGTYGYVRGDAYLTGGSDRLSANLAVSLSHNDGYGVNLFTGKKDAGEVGHSAVARGKALWRATPSLTVLLAGDYQDVDQDFLYRLVDGFPSISRPRDRAFHDGDQNGPNRYRFRYGGVSGKADADLGAITFTSLTALRLMRARYDVDLDRGPLPLMAASPAVEQTQVSQEFQLQSDAAARVPWVAGLYYIRIDEQYEPTDFRYGGSYAAFLGGRINQTLFSRGDAVSYAAYGQGTWPLGALTRLTLGLRYTAESRSIEARGEQRYAVAPLVRRIPGLPLLTEAALRSSKTFREPTWRASLDRRLSDELMGYLTVSRGFQSGGWNLQTPQYPAFAPERLDDLEAGVKFADRRGRVRADVNAFHYDYADIQVSAVSPTGLATTNAASAEVFGLGLQLDGRLEDGVDVWLGLQGLKTRYDSFTNASCANYSTAAAIPLLQAACDVTGNRFPFAPSLKLNAGASRRLSLGGRGALLVSGHLAFNSGYFSEPDNVVRQKAFTTLDASARWWPRPNGPSIEVWARNLTDAEYYASLATMPTVGVFQSPAAPRRLGVTLDYAF